MRKGLAVALLVLMAVGLTAEDDIIPAHKEWLELTAPIITKMEREVFLTLKSAEERNRFIQIFWKQRDPRPDTEENEFYQEYLERAQYADHQFGRQSSKRGIQTERGYYYLLLGPPLERTMYTTSSQILPLELWYYKGEILYGLPAYFYLIFYQPESIGEYRLYHPGLEGPERLIIHTSPGIMFDREAAYKIIRNASTELASASLSYLPGERSFDVSSFSSESIIAGIRTVSEKKYSDRYAQNYLTYKDYVETDYTHNFLESNLLLKVFQNSRQSFLHWAIEPKSINFANFQDQHQAIYQLLIRIEDPEGHLLLEKEEEIPLRITQKQYETHDKQLFSFQNLVPVIPGNHTLFLLLKNKTARDFTSHQRKIHVPEPAGTSSLSPLLLYHGRERLGGSQSLRAFSFSGTHYLVNSENNFLPDEEMGVFCQVYNIKNIAAETLQLQIVTTTKVQPIITKSFPINEALEIQGRSLDTGPIPLSSLNPGYYSLELSILDRQGEKLLSESENFILLAQAFPVIPWVFSKQHLPFPNSVHLYTLASQYFLASDYSHARSALEQALNMQEDPNARLLLGKTLYAQQDYQGSLKTVQSLYQTTGNRETAKLIALNHVALKEWAQGVIYLEKLLESSLEIGVLNLAGECYNNLKQPEKALPVLQKSLELNPDHPNIKQLLQQTQNAIEKKTNKLR